MDKLKFNREEFLHQKNNSAAVLINHKIKMRGVKSALSDICIHVIVRGGRGGSDTHIRYILIARSYKA